MWKSLVPTGLRVLGTRFYPTFPYVLELGNWVHYSSIQRRSAIRIGLNINAVKADMYLSFQQVRLNRVPAKVPYHTFNYRMDAAIIVRVESRYDEVTMR
ncbi:hypothetical protein AVEN_143116-1 [Araneus ventricosus]|uniref:Uncharacterized protein n=1 Tax=Araneus ventricosus TaxID=182803 RepID=A0A4Y2KGM7_ARAVE|nr:hypothetical protein AVEN_143116-1 [Araneus ventricosus]